MCRPKWAEYLEAWLGLAPKVSIKSWPNMSRAERELEVRIFMQMNMLQGGAIPIGHRRGLRTMYLVGFDLGLGQASNAVLAYSGDIWFKMAEMYDFEPPTEYRLYIHEEFFKKYLGILRLNYWQKGDCYANEETE